MFEPDEPTDKYLYHYTKKDIFLEKILPSRLLKLGLFSQTNDPGESHELHFQFTSRESIGPEKLSELQKFNQRIDNEIRRYCKILCLSMDNPNSSIFKKGFRIPTMWAHYAGNHTGICLVFDKRELTNTVKKVFDEISSEGNGQLWMESVKYVDENYDYSSPMKINFDELANIDVENYLKGSIKKYYQHFYFIKHIAWKSEQEFRIVLLTKNNDPIYIPIHDSLAAIIVGSHFPDVDNDLVINFCKELNIVYGKMQWCNVFPNTLYYLS